MGVSNRTKPANQEDEEEREGFLFVCFVLICETYACKTPKDLHNKYLAQKRKLKTQVKPLKNSP